MIQKLLALALLLIFNSAQAALVFTPTKFNPKTAKVIVVIHGCLQSAENMALGTGWNQIAEQENLVVIYPQTPAASNALDCWNWFLPANQKVDSGQLRLVRDQVQDLKKNLQISNAKTFVTGISSGGATAAGLMACFPNEFAAGAIHSGVSYGMAQNFQQGDKVLKDGPPETVSADLPCKPSEYRGKLFVIHGTEDKVVNPKNAERILMDFLPEAKPIRVLKLIDNGLPFTVTDYFQSGTLRGQFIKVEGLGHAWSGFNLNLRFADLLGPGKKQPTVIPYFSDKGPSATNMMWELFKQTR